MNAVPDMTLTAVKMLLSLGLVLALVWVAYKWMRRGAFPHQGPLKGQMIRVLANHYLGVKKTITMVEVPGSVLILGVSADRITLLSRIDDPATIAGLVKGRDEKAVSGFREHLQRLTRTMSGAQPSDKAE